MNKAAFFVGGFSVLALVACSWLQSPQGPQTAGLAAKDVLCAIAHDNEPVAQVLADCNIVADFAQAVQQILASTHAKEAEAARASCRPDDAGPGK